MTQREHDEPMEEPDNGHDSSGADGAGQSGDTQGLSPSADSGDESVEELVNSGQAYEAELIEGLEDAADHPEQPLHTREDQIRPPELAPIPGRD